MCLRITLLGVDEVRELGRVANEEDRSVVEYPVPVAFLSPDLDGEPTGIASSVCRSALASDGGETDGQFRLVPNFVEELGTGDVGDIVSHLKVSVGTSALGVHHSLRDALTVEVGQKVNVVEV